MKLILDPLITFRVFADRHQDSLSEITRQPLHRLPVECITMDAYFLCLYLLSSLVCNVNTKCTSSSTFAACTYSECVLALHHLVRTLRGRYTEDLKSCNKKASLKYVQIISLFFLRFNIQKWKLTFTKIG